jgi:D-3-phosphoglycerate dehydrogenase
MTQGSAEAQVVEALTLDLLEWLAARPRTYEETMDAWRTACPRMPVWENASDGGLVSRQADGGRMLVAVTASGRRLLTRHGRLPGA